MTAMIIANAVLAAARKLKVNPGVRQDDGGLCSRPPLAEAIANHFACLANSGTPFMTHLVE